MAIVAIRTIVVYTTLIVAMRIMGKRQLSELQPIELAVTLLISDLAVIPIQDIDVPLLYGIIPILLLISLELILSACMLKCGWISRLVSGTPVVIVKDGQVIQSALKKLRMTVDDLYEALRSQGVFDIADLALAIVETNGNISPFYKVGSRPPTIDELKIKQPADGTPLLIVSDGRLCEWALEACSLTGDWVQHILDKKKLRLSDVLMMTADKNKHYTIVKKEG